MNDLGRFKHFDCLEVDSFLAKGTVGGDVQPFFDAFRMELVVAAIEGQNLFVDHHLVQLFFDLLIGLLEILLAFVVVHSWEQLFLQEALADGLQVERFRTDDALILKL